MWFWEKEEEKEALSACYSATPAAGSQLARHRPPPSSVALARAARSCLSGLAGAAAGAPVSLTCVHITRRRWPFSPSSPFCSAAIELAAAVVLFIQISHARSLALSLRVR